MELLQPDIGLVFWMLLSFVIVLFVLTKFGFPVITKMVNERKAYIDESLKAADEANAQLANIKTEGEALIAKAREEQVKILNEAAATRDKIIQSAKEDAQVAAKKQLDEVRVLIQSEKDEAIRQVRREIATLSIEIAEKVIRKDLDKDKAQMDFIDRMLDEISVSKS